MGARQLPGRRGQEGGNVLCESMLHLTCLPLALTLTARCSCLSSSVRAAPGKGFWKTIMLSMTPCSSAPSTGSTPSAGHRMGREKGALASPLRLPTYRASFLHACASKTRGGSLGLRAYSMTPGATRLGCALSLSVFSLWQSPHSLRAARKGLPYRHHVVQLAGAGRQAAAAQRALAVLRGQGLLPLRRTGTFRFAFSSFRRISCAKPGRRWPQYSWFSASHHLRSTLCSSDILVPRAGPQTPHALAQELGPGVPILRASWRPAASPCARSLPAFRPAPDDHRHVDQVLVVLVAEEALAQLGQHRPAGTVAQQDVVVGPRG